ncbi:2978_t:CDS:2, partial [Dentiscutata heterogama]
RVLFRSLLEINERPRERVRQKPHLAIFIKFEARDRNFFNFSKIAELKDDHQKEYEKLEGRFQKIYRTKHKVIYQYLRSQPTSLNTNYGENVQGQPTRTTSLPRPGPSTNK